VKYNNYEEYLSKIFWGKREFLVTDQLIKKLRESFQVTDENARKIIQRAVVKGVIKSSKPFTLGKNRYVYFSPQYKLDIGAVKKVSRQYRPPLYQFISIMDAQQGIISYYEGLKITASPIMKDKTKVSSLKEIAELLIALNFIEEYHDENGALYYVYQWVEKRGELVSKHYTNMVLDSVLIPDVLEWLNKHNVIDNRNIVYRNKVNPTIGAIHNNLAWDAFAYTRTTGINTISRSDEERDAKKTLVVLDIVISRNYTESDLKGFYARLQIVRNSTTASVRKIFPIIVFRGIEESVSERIRALGFMTLGIGTIFGEKIYEVVSRLHKIKEVIKPEDTILYIEEIEQVLSTLKATGQESNLQNIKGDLFESLMYPLISTVYPNSGIRQGVVLSIKKADGKKEIHEYDYLIESHNYKEFIVFELKGYKNTDTIKLGDQKSKNTVKWFFQNALRFARNEIIKNPLFNNYRITGCFITSAQFSEDATVALTKINNGNIKPMKLDVYYDGDKLKELMNQYGLSSINRVLDKYYFVK
jgi:hypothetical protein